MKRYKRTAKAWTESYHKYVRDVNLRKNKGDIVTVMSKEEFKLMYTEEHNKGTKNVLGALVKGSVEVTRRQQKSLVDKGLIKTEEGEKVKSVYKLRDVLKGMSRTDIWDILFVESGEDYSTAGAAYNEVF